MRPRFKPGWSILIVALANIFIAEILFAAIPPRWIPRGVGGGGALFCPSISPYDPNEVYIASDMSNLFHTRDSGISWRMLNFRSMKGNDRMCGIQFTQDPNILYGLNQQVPAKSTDGGITWFSIPVPGVDPAYSVYADPEGTQRVLVSGYSELYISQDGGNNYQRVYQADELHIAGVFFYGDHIYVGTRVGLLISSDGGNHFTRSTTGGIPSNEEMVSFAGARENGTNAFFCVTWKQGSVYPALQGLEVGNYRGVYRLRDGDTAWVNVESGLGGNCFTFVSMCRTNISIAYVAGATGDEEYPAVYKTVNGGTSWENIFHFENNRNIQTGWRGEPDNEENWQQWWWGPQVLGFQVCPTDPKRVIASDMGFVHYTTNGGACWVQAYIDPSDQQNTNEVSRAGKAVHSVGLEDTAYWSLDWITSNEIFASVTDLHGTRSSDGGITWSFPTGLVLNTTYAALLHPTNGLLYAAVSSRHDIYIRDPYREDPYLDRATGAVMYSEDKGINWSRGFNHPAIDFTLDPNNPEHMYISGVNSTNGGIFVSTNFQSKTSAGWKKLTDPPRTEGHPYSIHVLNDGTLVCSYSARIENGDFTDSSGVFVSNNKGVSWLDRTASGMRYYTRDVVIDPHDPAQNTWYAAVWRDWWSTKGDGGLYRTMNRGVSWTRIMDSVDAVESCTMSPSDPNEMYVTTRYEGLWYCTNARAVNPEFMAVTNYPFKHPMRVFYNPFKTQEVWVVSYGGGLLMGRTSEPPPRYCDVTGRPGVPAQIAVGAEAGQRVVIRASSDLSHWESIATNTVRDNETVFMDPDAENYPLRFYSAAVEP